MSDEQDLNLQPWVYKTPALTNCAIIGNWQDNLLTCRGTISFLFSCRAVLSTLKPPKGNFNLVFQARLELTTYFLGGNHSIPLSYWKIKTGIRIKIKTLSAFFYAIHFIGTGVCHLFSKRFFIQNINHHWLPSKWRIRHYLHTERLPFYIIFMNYNLITKARSLCHSSQSTLSNINNSTFLYMFSTIFYQKTQK